MRYLTLAELPEDKLEAKLIKRRSLRFAVLDGQLYKRSVGGALLRCARTSEAEEILKAIHSDDFGNHSGGMWDFSGDEGNVSRLFLVLDDGGCCCSYQEM